MSVVVASLRLAPLLLVGCHSVGPASSGRPAQTTEAKRQSTDRGTALIEGKVAPKPLLPHVRVDRVHRIVEVDATVVFDTAFGDQEKVDDDRPPGVWLELVACTPHTREYESLLAVQARPSHIHQALLIVGLVPGAPMRSTLVDGKFHATEPTGGRVAVSIVVNPEAGSEPIPVNRWVIDRQTRRPMTDNVWLFAGSVFRQIDGKQVYMADLNGSVISLVNFGDDLLSRATMKTPQNDQQMWTADASALPPEGTPVVIRLKALDGKSRKSGKQQSKKTGK